MHPKREIRPRLVAVLALAAGLSTLAGSLPSAAQQQPSQPPKPEDLLGNIVVVAEGNARPLPKVAVYPSLSADIEDVTLRSVVRRDLDLCGEFEVLPEDQRPDGLYLSDTPVDAKAWAAKGVEALVRVSGKKSSEAGRIELRGQAYFVKKGADPVIDKRFSVATADVRVESHRIADMLIGALTGQNGSFASHMTFSSGSGKLRRVFTIDADGNNAEAVTSPDRTAIASTFGKNDELFYTASIDRDEYKIFGLKSGGPLPGPVKGSVYGIAFSKDRSQVALSIGVGATIKMFAGPDFASAKLASDVGLAMEPTFSPSGKLAYSGEGKWSQRIFVDNKPVSPDGLQASSPTFCNNPEGTRLVFAVGVGKNTDIVATAEGGGQLVRLTQSQGSNSYPACSPDGRLVAFFSTRKSGEGPGLYVMRLDGMRPKRVSTLLGDSLHWDPRAPGTAREITTPAPPK